MVVARSRSGRPTAMKRMPKVNSPARLDVWARGMIWGMHIGRVRREEMLEHLKKKDGTCPQINAIDKVLRQGEVWTVGGGVLGGRFQVLTTFNAAKLIRMIFRSGVLNVQRIEDN